VWVCHNQTDYVNGRTNIFMDQWDMFKAQEKRW
jgi:hypothetical protein